MVATRPAVMDFVFINTVCCIVMVEDKFVTVNAVEEYSGNIGTAPLILSLGVLRRSVVNTTPWPLYPREINPSCLPIE